MKRKLPAGKAVFDPTTGKIALEFCTQVFIGKRVTVRLDRKKFASFIEPEPSPSAGGS